MKIGIFSSSWPIGYQWPVEVEKALDFFKSKGHEIILGNLFYDNEIYRSANAQKRAAEINNLLDQKVDVLMGSIGGYVTNAILPYLDYEKINKLKPIFAGFSDLCCILWAVSQKCQNIRTLHGPAFVTSFKDKEVDFLKTTYETFVNIVEKKEFIYEPPLSWREDTKDWIDPVNYTYMTNEWFFENSKAPVQKVTGRLMGGNISVLTGVWGSEFAPTFLENDILLIEESCKNVAQFERMLNFLKINKIFDKTQAIILGKIDNYEDLGSNKQPIDVLREINQEFNLPIVWNVDFAHTKPMLICELNSMIEIDFENKVIKAVNSVD